MCLVNFSDFNKITSVLSQLDSIYGEGPCDYFIRESNNNDVNKNLDYDNYKFDPIVDNFMSGCGPTDEVHLSQILGIENKILLDSLNKSSNENESIDCNLNDSLYDCSNKKQVNILCSEIKIKNRNKSNLTVKSVNLKRFFLVFMFKKFITFLFELLSFVLCQGYPEMHCKLNDDLQKRKPPDKCILAYRGGCFL